MKVIETRLTRYTLGEDGIATATALSPESRRTGEVMSQTLDDLADLVGDTARPILWDPGETLPLTPGGWQAILGRIAELATGVAILVDEGREHLLGSFPTAVDSLLMPARVFTDETEARRWLAQFVEAPTSSPQPEA